MSALIGRRPSGPPRPTASESLRGTVIEAEHSCMTLRGVRATGSSTMTSTLLGVLRSDARSRAEFLALTGAAP